MTTLLEVELPELNAIRLWYDDETDEPMATVKVVARSPQRGKVLVEVVSDFPGYHVGVARHVGGLVVRNSWVDVRELRSW